MNSAQAWWMQPLEALSEAEWEALCDRCARCCLHKLEDEDSGEVFYTNVACRLLDTRTGTCRDYAHRCEQVSDCLQIRTLAVADYGWLPATCAYRLRAEGKPLPSWHPLLSGDPAAMALEGIAVAGRVISETEAGELEHHIMEDWGSL